jgi:hypothetical protein
VIAATTTRLRPVEVSDPVPADPGAWGAPRQSLERRQAVRALGRRFRRDPLAYLRSPEESLIKETLRLMGRDR